MPPWGVAFRTSKHEHVDDDPKLALVGGNRKEPTLFWLELNNSEMEHDI
jgi:hypothetical protein